jgi:hypothetical protein
VSRKGEGVVLHVNALVMCTSASEQKGRLRVNEGQLEVGKNVASAP